MELNLAKISIPDSSLVIRNTIKNLIFDFGGVICNIDVESTKRAFRDLGLKISDSGTSITDSMELFDDLETGVITPKQFRDELRKFFVNPVTDEQLDTAWNKLLLDIPEERIRLLEALRKNYRIFLLSNSNEIHYRKFLEDFRKKYGYTDFDALFGKAYFSFCTGMKKPSPEIFRHVLQDSRLTASETLFIDDTLMHVEGARNAGIHGYHLDIDLGEQIQDLFIK